MHSSEIREKFKDFYEKRGHTVIPSASLIPEKDSSLLFVNSGMFPLVPYLLGEKHPQGKRLVNSQKCFRSDDIEEIGDMRHTTFFEMLGNWSLGDYFKKEQLPWVFSLFVDQLNLDPKKIFVSVYRGNPSIGIEKDIESVEIWKEIFKERGIEAVDIDWAEKKGMQQGRIFYYSDKENWWSRSGVPEDMPINEPGGPDSEIFYDIGEDLKHHQNSIWKNQPCHINCDCGRFIEIGNSVFIEFVKKEAGFEKLSQRNVDFGGGLERLAMITQKKTSVFETDLFLPIIQELEKLSGFKYKEKTKNFEVIADHVKAATFIIGDEKGIAPSNKQQGYFVRRLLRRAVRHAKQLNIDSSFWTESIVEKIVEIYREIYPEINENSNFILKEIKKEYDLFEKTLERGLKEFEKMKKNKKISGKSAALLYQTYGFPIELTQELASEKNQEVDIEEFEKEMKKHKDLSRELSAGVFKSGLVDNDKNTVKLHTATHILLASLKKVLGEKIVQKGSNINSERLRFDFSHSEKLSIEQIEKIEELMNEVISKNFKVAKEEMSLEKALSLKVTASFKEKYPDMVLVYSLINDQGEIFSREICSGPHVKETSEIGKIKIVKEEACSSGVRRIKVKII